MMRYLVAYFSWSGNTQIIARQIHQLVGGDIFEIQPIKEYPNDYHDVLGIGKQEILSCAKPKLKHKLNSLDIYDSVFIGYPNWWNTFPAPVLTFLSENDFTGKTIIPFCTHGGGGSGRSFSDIAKICRGSVIQKGFSINGYAVSDNNTELEEYISKIKKEIIQ